MGDVICAVYDGGIMTFNDPQQPKTTNICKFGVVPHTFEIGESNIVVDHSKCCLSIGVESVYPKDGVVGIT